MQLSEKQLRSRRSRSIAMAWALVGFMALVFVVTVVKLGRNADMKAQEANNVTIDHKNTVK